MPIPALNALGFTALEDSQFLTDTPINGAMKFDTDGGLSISRRRFTRNAGRYIVTGFTEISTADKALFDQFFFSLGGGAAAFDYVHPLTGETISMKFSEDPPYTTAYVGIGATKLWTLSEIKLRSA